MELNDFVCKTAKPLPVFLLLDTSGSMIGYKIDTLNQCVRDMLEDFKSERMSVVELQLCVITFGGNSAQLHTDLVPVNKIDFNNLVADGMTPLGSALNIAASIINDKEKVPGKAYRPIVVLVSDGHPNDNWEGPLNEFLTSKRTSKCERWALGIGEKCDKEMLKKFINDPERPVFDASTAKEITKFFKFVTLSTITRTRSQNPNQVVVVPNTVTSDINSIKLSDLKDDDDDDDKISFDFGL